jgi:hypothetical protein
MRSTSAALREALPAEDVEEVGVGFTATAPAETLERAALALRGARARTGLDEQRIVALMAERCAVISVATLLRAERTGALDLALASCLADVYGSTTDCLSGRRPNRRPVDSLDPYAR